jgi:23S rRNA (uridine2552-2'-O)-methyltransferase
MVAAMAKRWVKERKKDGFYRMAKAKGYRSRAAYKLIQINKRFGLISEGNVVVDLGAAPGGWSQVALELVGDNGKVVAVDRKRMKPIEGVQMVRGDLTDSMTIEAVIKEIGGEADAVISDMAPRLSGSRPLDHAKSISLAETALEFAEQTLKKGGNFAVKTFQGDLYTEYLERTSGAFGFSQSYSPKASPAGSREVFVVGKDYLG